MTPSRPLIRRRLVRWAAAVPLLLFPLNLLSFGKNQVNAHAFHWTVTRSPHFLIYHTSESDLLVPSVVEISERAYDRLTTALEVTPSAPVSLFVYPNHNTFEENNVAPVGEGTGGVTEAYKNRIVLFNDGSLFWLEHVITHEFTHVLQFEVLYGGFWKSARLLKSPLYPLWFMEGLAEYGTGDMDRGEEDLVLRDAALGGRLPHLSQLHGFGHLKPHETTLAYKSGGSAVRFLAETYGEEIPRNILKGMRERFDVSALTAELSGRKFQDVGLKWREALVDRYREQAERLGLKEPSEYGTPLTEPGPLPSFDEAPVLSSDGRLLAFLTDRNGPREIGITDPTTGATRFVAGREWNRVENIHTEGRALSISPDGRWLAFAGEKEQRDYLYLYDMKWGRLRKVRTPFTQIRSPSFHPGGGRLVLVGMVKGTNDLYEVSLRGNVLRRVTSSPEDESDPVYTPDGASIVFSREVRRGDAYERDLASWDASTGFVRSLTAIPGVERGPTLSPDGRILVYSGQTHEGVLDLYRLDMGSGRVQRLTRVLGGLTTPFFSGDGRRLAYTVFRRGSRYIQSSGPDLWNSPTNPDSIVQSRFPETTTVKAGSLWSQAQGPSFPYRFQASTDIFFPVLYFSSQDGLFIASLWQASEQTGNHEVQGSIQYGSGDDFVDYNLRYTYKRFRPQIVALAGGDTHYQDVERIEQRREWSRGVGVVYPLDRFLRLETFAIGVHREDRYRGPFNYRVYERENQGSVSLVRDTSLGRYLSVTDGSRVRVTQAAARRVFGGTREYDASELEVHRFFPTGGESALAVRGISGVSWGPSPRYFRLAGGDRIRGYPRNVFENQSSRYVMGNLEWRVPLAYLEGGPAPLFPEVAFKALFGVLFFDAGYDGTPRLDGAEGFRRSKASAGAGVRVPSFLFQTYPLTLAVDVVKRLDASDWSWYFYIGPRF